MKIDLLSQYLCCKYDRVLYFISKFKSYEKDEVLEKTFLKGYCYQFAIILKDRFDGEILYEPIEGHFVTMIGDKLYDIRGDVTSLYKDKNLIPKEEYLQINNVIKGCLLKKEDEDE